ncbi:MAG: 3-oxoacyl-[acyl-carrier-protein] reductase [Armatimonadetes bacterium]|nr:3-oxoacyl-[acyl-carrier-protein] reductase [Armatimonadota bacterium]
MDLSGRVALVTGASGGIGRAIAEELARSGAQVALNYSRSAAKAEEAAASIKGVGRQAFAVQADVTDPEAVEAMFKQVQERWGRLDILVNNSGVTRDGLLMRMKDEDWDAVLDTNLKGAFHCSRAAVKVMMKQRSGRIVNISSVVGVIGNPGQSNYCASKAGLIGFTKALAKEVGSRGITVNAIAPGFITTEMTAQLPEEVGERIRSNVPLGQFGEPADVAAAVAYLASDGAKYVTGHVLHVDGGLGM